jgi:hypothetical protein
MPFSNWDDKMGKPFIFVIPITYMSECEGKKKKPSDALKLAF